MQLLPMTRLDAVNEIISVAGRTPVSTLSGPLPTHVAQANALIDSTSRELQGFKWYFNSLDKHFLAQDGDGRYPAPPNAVEVDTDNPSDNYILRDGFLFDLKTNTNVFPGTGGRILVHLVLLYGFEDIPPVAQNLVAKRAARRFAQKYVRDNVVIQTAAEDEETAHSAFIAMDVRQQDASVYTTDVGRRILSRQPPTDYRY